MVRVQQEASTKDQQQRVQLVLREEFATADMQSLVQGTYKVLHDAAKDVACNRLNQVLNPDN